MTSRGSDDRTWPSAASLPGPRREPPDLVSTAVPRVRVCIARARAGNARDPERSTPLRHPLPLLDVADRFSACAMREARLATDWPFAPNRAYVPIPGAPSPARSSAGALSFNADESDRVLMSPFLGASLWHGSRFTRYGPSGSSHAVSRPRAQSVPNQRGVLFFQC